MKDLIKDYINKTEALLLMYPKSTLLKTYLKKLKYLNRAPEAHLSNINEIIPTLYKSLKKAENTPKNKVLISLFSNMVNAVKISVDAEKIKAKYPDFDDSLFTLKES